MNVAITRKVGPSLARCELTHLAREPIDVALAARQHDAYERALAQHGFAVESLPAEPDFPDSVFVEDTAVVLDEVAVLTHPGAASRRGEVASVRAALAPYRELVAIEPPGTLDGGDVLILGRRVLVGLSSRSSREGIAQLAELLGRHGYQVEGVLLTGCLHLKTGVTRVAPETVLLNPAWVDRALFDGCRLLEVDPEEPQAANALDLGDAVLFPDAFPRTAGRLADAGVRVVTLNVSELAKAEAGVTCCSLLIYGGDRLRQVSG